MVNFRYQLYFAVKNYLSKVWILGLQVADIDFDRPLPGDTIRYFDRITLRSSTAEWRVPPCTTPTIKMSYTWEIPVPYYKNGIILRVGYAHHAHQNIHVNEQ